MPITLLAPAALAHPGHEGEIGTFHVLGSIDHIAVFLGIGVAAALLMLVRHPAAIVAANLILLAFVLILGAGHGIHGGVLFGIETAIAGALLALGAWRATHVLYAYIKSRRREERV
ncbi:MAG: HupE/UreJ family protein [Pseudomonadota bacterium]